jgi:hypothetical protein
LVFRIKGRIYAEVVREKGAEEDTWILEGGGNRRLEGELRSFITFIHQVFFRQ